MAGCSSPPEKQREILVLRVVVGLSAEETAEAVGSTPGAVRVAQHRALARLRKSMPRRRWSEWQTNTVVSDDPQPDVAADTAPRRDAPDRPSPGLRRADRPRRGPGRRRADQRARAGLSRPGRRLGGYDDDDLIALLLAWRDEVDREPIPELVEPDTAIATIRPSARPPVGGPLSWSRWPRAAVMAIAFTGVRPASAREAQPGDTLWGVSRGAVRRARGVGRGGRARHPHRPEAARGAPSRGQARPRPRRSCGSRVQRREVVPAAEVQQQPRGEAAEAARSAGRAGQPPRRAPRRPGDRPARSPTTPSPALSAARHHHHRARRRGEPSPTARRSTPTSPETGGAAGDRRPGGEPAARLRRRTPAPATAGLDAARPVQPTASGETDGRH